MISEHLDKNNLHHAYLIEGARDEVVPEILEFMRVLNVETSGNPDFCNMFVDNFKIDEAFYLRDLGNQKSFSEGKKIFIVCVNSINLQAQNVLLKMFEEPISDTHFFLIVPETDALLQTLVSRFYLIKHPSKIENEIKDAKNFLNMSLQKRMDFLKELLPKKNEEVDVEDKEDISKDSNNAKALKLLNALEVVLHSRFLENSSTDRDFFNQILKVREFLRQPGSSVRTLMESVALVVPKI